MGMFKHKPANVGRIALKRHAGSKTFHPAGIRTTAIPIHNQMNSPLGYQVLVLKCCNRLHTSNKLYFEVRAIEITRK